MPTYKYHCGVCNTEFEEFKKISQRNDVDCPICQSTPPEVGIVIQPVGSILKGSNWAKDNYGLKTNKRGKK